MESLVMMECNLLACVTRCVAGILPVVQECETHNEAFPMCWVSLCFPCLDCGSLQLHSLRPILQLLKGDVSAHRRQAAFLNCIAALYMSVCHRLSDRDRIYMRGAGLLMYPPL
jgi:hypothetical protein